MQIAVFCHNQLLWHMALGMQRCHLHYAANEQHLLDLMAERGFFALVVIDRGDCPVRLVSTLRSREVAEPILVLEPQARPWDVAAVLDAGADGYIAESYPELLRSYAMAVIRRSQARASEIVRCNDLQVNLHQRRVFLRGQSVRLTKPEYEILASLARQQGNIVSMSTLANESWYDPACVSDCAHLVRVFINRLRQKIGPDYIVTHKGFGYSMPAAKTQTATL